MKFLLYIGGMRFILLTTDPKKIGNKNFSFVNDEITKEGTYEQRFAEYFVTFAEKYDIKIIHVKPTRGFAKIIKFKGYGQNLYDINKKIKSILK